MAALTTVLVAPLIGPVVTGWQPVIVDGGSMEPTLAYGDVVLIAPPTGDDLHVGAVVTARNADGGLYTHRITSVQDGRATTRGDANDAADIDPLTQSNVVGTVTAHFAQPWARMVRALLTIPGRLSLGLVIVAIALFPLAARRREDRTPTRVGGRALPPPDGDTDSEDAIAALQQLGLGDPDLFSAVRPDSDKSSERARLTTPTS